MAEVNSVMQQISRTLILQGTPICEPFDQQGSRISEHPAKLNF
jgi:hypothetical protein